MNNQEYFEIELPGIKLYNDLKSIKIKKITPFIHKKLLSLYSLEADTQQFINFINDLIIDFDLNELYVDDLSYILYQIRINCYNMIPITLSGQCPFCEKENKVTLDPGALDIKECSEFPKVILDNFGEVQLRFRKVKDDLEVDKLLESKKLDKTDLFYRTLAVDALVLDQWKPIEEVWNLMESGQITAQDTLKIENTLINNTYGVKEEMTYKCRHCNEEVTQEYTLNLGDYFPAAIA